ncbi:MAG: hypothetical protein ACYCUI_16290 [Vulcanimicrobiaceae bacterium]
MKYDELFAEIKSKNKFSSDKELASFLGITQATLITKKKSRANMTPKSISRLLTKYSMAQTTRSFSTAIKPIVEHYPIKKCESKQGAKWEILPSGSSNLRESKIKGYLINSIGIYFFYDSMGQVIYNGKTISQNLWKEINLAFNRDRGQHKVFRVPHPSTGSSFEPAWKSPRQPVRKPVYLHEIAGYFSAYEISKELISIVEALFIRSICNDLSNIKMEKLKSVT